MKSITVKPFAAPIKTEVALPGCIGYTIRALNIAAMTKGSVEIVHPLKSDDTHAMLEALRTIGIKADEDQDSFTIHGNVDDVRDRDYVVDIGLSGRTARSILALLAVVPGTKTVTCAEPFKKRPIGDLVDGLRQLGADIMYLEREGYLPVRISSQSLRPGIVSMPGQLSSQYFSAIMMVAPLVGDVTIEVQGEQSSKPFVDMTIGIMSEFGVTVENNKYRTYKIAGAQQYKSPDRYIVEPESTSASYFFAMAAITRSSIKVLNLSPDSLQGDRIFADVLQDMGCNMQKNVSERWIQVAGTGDLHGVTVDMNATPDLVPTLAVVASFARGKTTITNIAHARIKETDRIESPRRELEKMGIRTEATEDSLIIYGGTPHAAIIDTYHDHRMAMAFAVAGTRISGIVINDPAVVCKSFPEFWDVLSALTMEKNIVLTGMRGSGKSTIGQVLAKRLGRRFINMDSVLEECSKMTVPAMVAKYGWEYFRTEESKLAQELSGANRTVIATGGGVILRETNVSVLKQNGYFVFLDASIDNLEARLRDETDGRPALTNASDLRSELEMVLTQRLDTYRRTADCTISTDGRTPDQIVNDIVANIQKEHA